MITADSTTTGEENPTGEVKSEKSAPPYKIYVGILVATLAVRFADLLIRDTDVATSVRNSPNGHLYLGLAAVVTSFASGWFLKRHLPKTIAWLLCCLVGGATTLITDSSAGIVIGAVVGAQVVFMSQQFSWNNVSNRLLFIAPRVAIILVRTVFPVTVFGLTTGAAMALAYIRFAAVGPFAEIASLFGVPIVGGIVLVGILRRTASDRRWYGWLSWMLLFVFCIPVSLLATSYWDSCRRQLLVPNLGTRRTNIGVLLSEASFRSPKWIQNRLVDSHADVVVGINLGPKDTRRDIEIASGFPCLKQLVIDDGCIITDSMFDKLHRGYLQMFVCHDNTNLTAAAIRSLDLERMYAFSLRGPNFTDDCLQGLRNIPRMVNLSLDATQVTSNGLKSLDPQAPIKLLSLKDTQVDDDALAAIAALSDLAMLDLSGTRVTGSGLLHFRGKHVSINLDNTPLQEKYLADLLPAGPQPRQMTESTDSYEMSDYSVDCGGFIGLSLRGVPLTREGLKTIAMIRGLVSLDITGTEIGPETLAALTSLPSLRSIAIDGDLIGQDDIAAIDLAVELTFTYDARKTNADKIRRHVAAVPTKGSGVRQPFARRNPATWQRNVIARFVVKNMQLTDDVISRIDDVVTLNANAVSVTYIDAITPSGETKTYSTRRELKTDFPNAFPYWK